MPPKTIVMQNILIPTDFSQNAFHALSYGTKLLFNEECTFFLLNVYGNKKKGFKKKAIGMETQGQNSQLEDKSQLRLNTMVKRIRKANENQKHTYELRSICNDLTQTLHSLIEEKEIDLIVMGNKGRKSSIPVFLGSTTTKTLQSVKKCPVLTVPKSAAFKTPKVMAFATDFKRPYTPKVLDALRAMALHCGAIIRIVHINEREQLDEFQRSNLTSLLSYLEPVINSVHWMPNFISKTKVIQVFLEDLKVDMLAMVNYEHGFVEKMLREPIIEKMVFNIDIPFLVIPSSN